MIPLDAYSPDYQTARSRFRTAVADRGWATESHPISAPGFADGDLTIDVARIGATDAKRLIVISSGLHGGEGFFGSAVQLAWLDSLPRSWEPPPGCAVLLLHALNPFGFARLRRVNENNVDLNRNFLALEEFARLKESTGKEYGPLDPYLNPTGPPGCCSWAPFIFLQMRLRLGAVVLAHILPAGQYAFPKGIFYGGEKPAASTEIVMGQMPRWLGSAKLVLHLDFHTGLGAYAQYQLLSSDPENSVPVKIARHIFGRDRVELDREMSGGYHNHGDMGEWLSRTFADRGYVYLCAEFGTYGSVRIAGKVRRENQAHHWETPDSSLYRRIKQEALEAFVPRSSSWRWPVIRQSLELIQSALKKCADGIDLPTSR